MLKSLFIFLFSVQANALVDMKNANYSNTWVDMDVPGSGYDLKIVRTYNSRSLFNGMFGFGWCSDFETSMEINAEGNIKVKECGGGLEVTFSPREVARADVDKTIRTIVSKMKADKKSTFTESYYKTFSAQLLEDDNLRSEYAQKYGIKVDVKEGSKFFANGREVEHFIFNKSFYTRNLPDGSSQRFDLQGRLTHFYDKNNNFLRFSYEKDLISQIEDNNARKLLFSYYPNKKVKMIRGPNGIAADYKFSNLDDLSYVKNSWLNEYNYTYDELHNLVKATWPDKSFISLKYDVAKDWVVSFQDRDKCIESYKYESSPNDPKNHYWSIAKKTCGNEVVAENRYEFWHKQRADGQIFLQRVLTDVNGSITDISYHEVFGKPLSIRRNADRMTFEYYPDGLVKARQAPGSKMEYAYHPTHKKVSKVTTIYSDVKGKIVTKRSTDFQYDNKGNIARASNSDGQIILMTYDPRGRISTITDQAKKVVKIEYEDRYGKPSIVSRPGLGTIKVTYKPNGEINNVESKEGPTVAMQVASTFNNLLDVIAPATADLYL